MIWIFGNEKKRQPVRICLTVQKKSRVGCPLKDKKTEKNEK